ncbi:FAD-dependent oxidoreductase [Croceicoccus ponticola]|uniref:FAD-dependent oxidoreductase n=1 Tax=Croceicoccus ponticola TaxID=2217664 RepID=A0A437GU68_9SPHN|nr:FAD-dependent oxidoreductase [Croceicoccus ponticola]RVQ64848.1 FAD-dependent oxidoreductase [Croceicoccus ponticola]
MNDYDVIVVGAGGAGLAAALTAADAGKRVLVVEAADRAGGSTALSGGVFYAAGTSVQREAGIADDTPDDMFRYYMTLNQYKPDPAIVRRLCQEATPAFEWLRELGVTFTVDDLYASGVDKVRRGHRAAGHGAEIAEVLEGHLSTNGADVALSTRVQELLIEDGRCRGIVVDGAAITADAVVLATGGFGANPAMLAELYPDAALHGDLHWYIGSDHCVGDGIDIALAAGGELTPRNRGLLLLTPGFARDLESYLPGWLMMVNRQGHRFVDETIEYSVLATVLREQDGRECYAILDEGARMASATTDYRPAPNWHGERLLDHVAAGTLQQADTLEELAAKIGLPPDALAAAAHRYSAMADAGEDRDFFKPGTMLRPVRSGPFYAARIVAAIVCWTGVGIRIDPDARVLATDGTPIPGLYAAGETTGGMHGDCYAAGGASIANAIVFGRIAGAGAAGLAGETKGEDA